ncbi:MAG: DNA ligase D [Solirubrobacteraceae bacterium]
MAGLDSYERKRDFQRTPEPRGGSAAGKAQRRFVVQEHHARRLHWDLRLERDGVLKSWAVPNGIPQEPGRNRKAIPTEDHPLSYADFEGEIPAGSYGAGMMRIWDQGTYECEKWTAEKITLTFGGERLSGAYAMFRTRDGSWMIHRVDPPLRAIEPMPERLAPMLASAGSLPADERAWGHEVKWDGIRAIAYCEPGSLRLFGRGGGEISARYPELRALARELGSRAAILDGEIIAFDDDGRPSFERLQLRMQLTSESAIRRRAKELPVVLALFDLLYLDGRSTTSLPYSERRRLLEGLKLDGAAWSTPSSHRGDGSALLAATAERGLEGIVSKRLDSVYEPGRRTRSWVKVKHVQHTELLIGGWLPGSGRRAAGIGALLLGSREDAAAGALRYAGRVGSGFTEGELDRLESLLVPLARPDSPFAARRMPSGARWVEPRHRARVRFTEWTRQGLLRHPVYECLSAAHVSRVEDRALALSNTGKVLFPVSGFTKGDLIEFYREASAALLPHLRGRPLTMKRYPDGVEGKFFYEKRCPEHRPDWVKTAQVRSGSGDAAIPFCLVNDLPTLIWTANLASIELHPSLSLAQDPDCPTALVFDLDPGAPAGVVECCEVALLLRELFAQLQLETLIKTSGGKGLQLYLPLNSPASYAQTKPLARAVAELLERRAPDLVVSRMNKALRRGRVLIDWSQNDRHKTTVSVLSVRARERPMVSTPITWQEVERAARAEDASLLEFDTTAALARLARHGDLFASMLTLQQALPEL